MRLLLFAAFLLASCDASAPLGTDDDGDAAGDGAASDSDGIARDAATAATDVGGDDGSADADAADEPGPPDPGPLTFVADDVEVLEDRVCDLDGDGDLDNSLADTGPPGSTMLALALNAALVQLMRDEGERYVFHFPWVDDRGVPADDETRLIAFFGMDLDVPPDPADDFSGEEPFDVWRADVDGCGEPRHVFDGVTIVAGELSAEGGTVPMPGLAPGRGASVWGTIERAGARAELELCAYMLVRELGDGHFFPDVGELTTLETLLSAGVAFGLPGVSGVVPDVDVDGDGLEMIVVDAEQRIASCVDGDGTEIEGRECWRDERIADAFSVTMAIGGAPARLGGLERRWRPRDCSDPPAQSLWSVCREPEGRRCEPGDEAPCATSCGEGVARCRGDCTDFGVCRPSSSSELGLDACDDATLVGDGGSCGGDPEAVQLVDDLSQARGFRHARTVRVGTGPVTIDATTHVTTGYTLFPADGWAVVAYRGDVEDWGGGIGWRVGVDRELAGYALEWHFFHLGFTGDDVDVVYLRGLPAGAEDRVLENCLGPPDCAEESSPPLDSGEAGVVEQRLRLVIEPDLPETRENEMTVTGAFVGESASSPPVLECRGWDCPVQARPGDVLTVGVTSGTAGGDARIRVPLGEGLRITAEQTCPESP